MLRGHSQVYGSHWQRGQWTSLLKTMPSHFQHVTAVWFKVKKKSVFIRLFCMQKHKIEQWRSQTVKQLTTQVIYQARREKNFTFKTSTINVFSSQTLTEGCESEHRRKHACPNFFWNMLLASNLEWVYIYKKTIKFLSLNIKYFVKKRFVNRCLLFLIMFHTVSKLFWSCWLASFWSLVM